VALDDSLRIVFTTRLYLIISVASALAIWTALALLDEYLFFQPFLIFYLRPGGVLNFSLIVLISLLSGIAISMNIFRLAKLKRSLRKSAGTGLVGSAVGFIAGVCGCTSVGLAIISLLGTAGGLATGFVVNYQIPLRVLSVSLLIMALYSVSRNIGKEFQLPERSSLYELSTSKK